MDFQIEPYFTIIVSIMAVVFVIDRLVLRKRRIESYKSKELRQEVDEASVPEPWLIEQVNSIFPVLLFVWVFRSFVIEPFQIPSSSMEPTLEIGDFILVNKFAYGLRSPVSHDAFIPIGLPERGDVAVFIPPIDERYYIKRIIGIPGDRIRYDDKRLYINGEAMVVEITGENRALTFFNETLGDVTHKSKVNRLPSLDAETRAEESEGEWVVPDGHYFVMGDNRSNSYDSRLWRNPKTGEYLSFVPEDHLVGKAFAVWMHWRSWSSLPTFANNRVIN